MTCRTCQHSYRAKPTNQLTCGIDLPAKVSKALGFSDPYSIPDAPTNPDWNCAFYAPDKEKDET